MSYLADVNVWVALAAQRHVFHLAARRWFQDLGDESVTFCRVTQMGLLRLLTNKHVMQEETVDAAQAWRVYQILRSDRRVEYQPEPPELPELWDLFTQGQADPRISGLTPIYAPLLARRR